MYIYIYIYRLIDILTHQAIRSFTFYFYFINKHRSTMRSRDSWGKGTSVVVCSEKYPFRTKLVVLLSVCTSSVCMTVRMARKIWIMIFRRGLREEGGIRLNFEKRVIIFFNYRPHLFHLVVALHAYWYPSIKGTTYSIRSSILILSLYIYPWSRRRA